MNKDLTIGKPSHVIFTFCIPLFGSIIFQQLYNIADSLVVGKYVGENALAAVGNSYEITLIFLAIAFGCNIGCSVVVSSLFGAAKYKDLKTAVYTTFISSTAICLLLMIFGRIFSSELLMLINTPKEILSLSEMYLNIYIYGLPFVFLYNVSTGIFSALGDSKTPFIFLMCSSLANIGMDILFVREFSFIFRHGVDGVAWATFICQGISCFLAVYFVFKRLSAIKAKNAPLFSPAIFKKISAIAIPSMLQQGFVSIGNVLIQGIINSFGTGVIAGYSASVKLNNLVITSFVTLGNGISNYTAQNMGASKYSRIREGFRAGLFLIWVICIPITIIYFFDGKLLVRLFLDSPSDIALQTGGLFLKILSPFYFIISAKIVSDGILRGVGKMNTFMTSTFTDLVLRVVLAKALSLTALGSTGIWVAWPIGWIIATILSYIFYKIVYRNIIHNKKCL